MGTRERNHKGLIFVLKRFAYAPPPLAIPCFLFGDLLGLSFKRKRFEVSFFMRVQIVLRKLIGNFPLLDNILNGRVDTINFLFYWGALEENLEFPLSKAHRA